MTVRPNLIVILIDALRFDAFGVPSSALGIGKGYTSMGR